MLSGQKLIRSLSGVMSTSVGHSAGDLPKATYRNRGNHAEAIEIIFNVRRHIEICADFSRNAQQPRRLR